MHYFPVHVCLPHNSQATTTQSAPLGRFLSLTFKYVIVISLDVPLRRRTDMLSAMRDYFGTFALSTSAGHTTGKMMSEMFSYSFAFPECFFCAVFMLDYMSQVVFIYI